MPVSRKPPPALRTLQARVIAPLIPRDPSTPPICWPVVNRAQLAARAGFTAISGSITRALNGVRPGSTSDARRDADGNIVELGKGHPGLLAMGLVVEIPLDIEGVVEVNYRATLDGVRAYRAYIAQHGELPPPRDRETSTNVNQGKGENHRSKRGKNLDKNDGEDLL